MQLKRCYQVKPLGPALVERKVVVYKKDKDSGKKIGEFSMKKVEYPETFLVMFPRGHSIRVLSRERLAQLGLSEEAQVVDMDTGLPPPGMDSSEFNPIHGSISSGNAMIDALGE